MFNTFSKNTKISNTMKMRSMVAELLYAGGYDEANSRFSNFCERA